MRQWLMLASVSVSLLLDASGVAAERKPLTSINTEWVEQDPWLSPDGYTLYFTSNRDGGDFNIHQTQWDGRKWSEPARLGALVNSDFDDLRPNLSADGQWLLFISHRGRYSRGSWLCRRQPDGSWGRAEYIAVGDGGEVDYARIGPDGRTIFYQSRSGKRSAGGREWDMSMKYNPAKRFWDRPQPCTVDVPDNEVPGARWRFFAENGDIHHEPTEVADPRTGDSREVLNAVAASSVYGQEDEDYWVSEAQNLVDGLDDTSWISRAGMPVEKQWVLLSLNGDVKYAPALSRAHSLRIHAGPVDSVSMEKRGVVEKVIPDQTNPGTRPARLRILGGMDVDSLRELAVADLPVKADSPWHQVVLKEPAYLRYLKIEVLETTGANAPFVAFNEVEVYGAGLSAARPIHRVATDENNNITFDGEPFFPVYVYGSKTDARVAERGFNSAIQIYDVASDMARLAVLDRAEDMGFKVFAHVPWVETEADRKKARNQLLAIKHHPALLGYLMSDEAGHSKEIMEKDARRAAFIHKYDDNHFTMLNDLYPQNYPRSSKFVDVFSIDPYPHIVGMPYSYQAEAVDAAYRSVEYKKPVLVVNASWGPIISPVENRLCVYLALIHGAKGISWFAIGVIWEHPDHWGSITRCAWEINQLRPVLFAPDTKADSPLLTHTRIENPGARIDVMIKEVNGEVWMLAANCEPHEAKVRFSFGWGEEIVIREVMADHPRAWSMTRGDFTRMDTWPPPESREPVREARPVEMTFVPYGVRVFRMKPAGKIAPHYEPRTEGTRLAMVNKSIREQIADKVKQLRQENRQAEAKQVVSQFWSQYGDRVSVDDLATLMDNLGEDAGPEEILADYGRLAQEHPEAENWPKWVYKIVKAMVGADRRQDARQWMDRLIEGRPDSFWRANAEVLVNPASARDGHKPWTQAVKLQQKPTIDGELNEPVWQDRVSFRNTVYLDSSKNPQETEFAVAYDDEALYVAVRAIEPQPSRIVNRVDKNDRAVWSDDCVVIYLDAELDYFDYQQFIFNTSGVKWDGTGDRLGRANKGAVNADIERKTSIKDDAWQLEIRMPFKELGLEHPPAGMVWGLGVQRWRQIGGALPTVWGNERGTSHDDRPERFGFLVFE